MQPPFFELGFLAGNARPPSSADLAQEHTTRTGGDGCRTVHSSRSSSDLSRYATIGQVNTNNDDRINHLADELRVWNAVVVVGAGISAQSGLPLAGQLSPLLWHAFDADEAAFTQLMSAMASRAPTTKQLIGDDERSRRVGLQMLPAHAKARSTFQAAFAALDSARDAPSPTHDSLVELLHRGLLELIVSLNWDTQLEKAYERRYGRRISPNGPELHKLHGDAASPDERWTYPGEPTQISDSLRQRLSALANERPRLLIVIGYSEGDETIVQQLIKPYGRRWRVVRISPNRSEPDDIPLQAKSALRQLLSRVGPSPETAGWEYVNFSQQADLGSALLGHSLGPSHVRACPRLPEVDVTVRQLSITGRVALVGRPGSGKSISAYQAAYSLSENNWEVLRLVKPTLSERQLLKGIAVLRYRTLLLVDDAHRLAPLLCRRVEDCASARVVVLTVFTEEASEHANSVTVAGGRAVQILARTLLERRRETLGIVRKLDDQIGDGYLDVHLEDRVAEAGKAETPWQFSFILTGGWRRARQELAVIHDLQRADLLLLGVASVQVRSLGSVVDQDRLSQIVKSLGRDRAWLEQSKEALCRRRMLMSENDLRCPHLRLSLVVLHVCCGLPKDPEWPLITAMLRLVLCDTDLPLRGVWWLLDELRFADGFRWSRHELIDEPTWRVLVDHCWTASTEDRGDACVVLEALIDWYPEHLDELKLQTGLLQQWLEKADARWCIGASRLLNSIHNTARDFGVSLCRGVRPETLAQQLSQSSVAVGYSWGRFLDRIGVAAGKTWRRALAQSLNLKALESLEDHVNTDDDLWRMTQLAVGVSCISTNAALSMIRLLDSPASPTASVVRQLRPMENSRTCSGEFWDMHLTFYDFVSRSLSSGAWLARSYAKSTRDWLLGLSAKPDGGLLSLSRAL